MLRVQKRKLREGFLVTHLWEGFKGMKGKKFASMDLIRERHCQVKIVNKSETDIIFCWVDPSGKLHHFSPINNGSIRDRSVSNVHNENTVAGHAFVAFKSRRSVEGIKRLLPNHISEILAQVIYCIVKYLSSNAPAPLILSYPILSLSTT